MIGLQGDTPKNASNSDSRSQKIEILCRRYSKIGMLRQRLRRIVRACTWLCVIQPLLGAKRFFDLCAALIFLFVLSPLIGVGFLLSGFKLEREPRLGRWCTTFQRLCFASDPGSRRGRTIRRLHLKSLPVLFNILRGDMTFVGPRAVSVGELSPRERAVRRRTNTRPGLISPWWIRQRANIDYQTELATDLEYVEEQSLLGDMGILLRAIPAILYGQGVASAPDKLTLLGIPITNITMNEAVETICEQLDGDQPRQVCFVNADCANIAYHDPDYLAALKGADICLADGIGMKLAGKLLAREIRQNVNGTDLFPGLCQALEKSGKGVFLLGARPGVAEDVAAWMKANHPGIEVRGCQHGYFTESEQAAVFDRIRTSRSSLLLVAFGAPSQDVWIRQNLSRLNINVGMGVGGLFDFYSGRIARAPLWMREIGMEWLYRLTREPRRLWKRYLVGNVVFLYRVLRERYASERFKNAANDLEEI